jgi:hypothetical protein
MKGLIALFMALGFSLSAYAQGGVTGKLSFNIQGRTTFLGFNLQERNGIIEGFVRNMDGQGPLRLWHTSEHMHFQVARDVAKLKKTVYEGSTLYWGWLPNFRLAKFKVYHPKDKPWVRVRGTIKDVDFSVQLNWKKPHKMTFFMSWENEEFFIRTTPKEGEGTCEGRYTYKFQKVADIFCSSEGTMLNDLFKNPDHAIAWLASLFVYEEETPYP